MKPIVEIDSSQVYPDNTLPDICETDASAPDEETVRVVWVFSWVPHATAHLRHFEFSVPRFEITQLQRSKTQG